MMYRALFRHQRQAFFRTKAARRNIVVWVVFGLISLYTVFALVGGGILFADLVAQLDLQKQSALILNEYLLGVFGSLFGLRFLFQRSPQVGLQPYLHLPVPRDQLVRYFQVSSLLSLHNLLPLLFFVPFFMWHVWPYYGLGGSLAWMVSVLMLIVASNYANTLIRLSLSRNDWRFLVGFSLFFFWLILDQVLNTLIVNRMSSMLFDAILEGNWVFLLFIIAAVDLYLLTTTLLKKQVGQGWAGPNVRQPRSALLIPETFRRAPTARLVWLEIVLMLRNRRPKHYMLISIFFSTGYLIFLLLSAQEYAGYLFGAIIGLFASGGFALNYGQLLFSWESSYFDGIITRPFNLRTIVKAKLILLQGSCVLLFILSLPLFLLIRPDLLDLHFAFLFYNAGVTSILMLLLSVNNKQRVDITKSGGFFNYEGFSSAHWLWFIPTALPPVIILYLFESRSDLGLLSIATLGIIGVLAFRLWEHLFATKLMQSRYEMAQGFKRAS
ncbi:MAG: DUF5687 family protein [Bacteroidota bacterium]